MSKYSIREGARVSGVSADVLASELSRLDDENGGLTAPVVVEAARPKDALLHPAFEWRDKIAAEAYRLAQARNIIRAVVVTEKNDDGEDVKARVYAWVPPAESASESDSDEVGKYRKVAAIVNQPDQFTMALMALNRKLQEATAAVRDLEIAGRSNNVDGERLARISMAVRALEAASAAVAFH